MATAVIPDLERFFSTMDEVPGTSRGPAIGTASGSDFLRFAIVHGQIDPFVTTLYPS
jgi:hypothetical protein